VVARTVLLAALGLTPAFAQAHVAVRVEERGREPVVRRVRIGPAGIRIERYGSGDSVAGGAEHAPARIEGIIKVGRHGLTVVSGGGDSVIVDDRSGVHGPGVVVDAGNAGLVRVFADAHVPAGRTVLGDVVAVFGSVDVEGTVEGDAVAVFGSVRLHPGAQVAGDAVAIGGVLDHPPGARVSGQSVALGFFAPGWGAPTLGTLLAGVFIGWLFTLVMGWLLALIFPERMRRIGGTASRHTAGSFFLGLVSAPLLVIACVFLAITIVGIPFAILLLMLYPIAVWAGQIAASYVLGCRVLHRRPGENGLMGPIAAGTILVAVLFVVGAVLAMPLGTVPEGPARMASLFFTLLGVLLVVGLSVIGTGALILSRMGSRSPGSDPAAHSPATPAAAPSSAGGTG
jgi:hypothetical protein